MSEFPVPGWLVEHARRFYASGEAPAVPRVAATVALLRRIRGTDFEVYLLRRAATMSFASGMYAFPGGSVDPRDADAPVAWLGPSAVDWAARLGLPPAEAQAVVCAAVREVFEESGVLLATRRSALDRSAIGGPEWEDARQALVSRELSLAELFVERDLALRSDLLVPWSRWVTPEFEPRRYDTYFFVAVLPAGQEPRDVSGEADHTMWIRPHTALERQRAGRMAMLPPTIVTLQELAVRPGLAGVLEAVDRRDAATAIMPRIEFGDDGRAPRLVVAEM